MTEVAKVGRMVYASPTDWKNWEREAEMRDLSIGGLVRTVIEHDRPTLQKALAHSAKEEK